MAGETEFSSEVINLIERFHLQAINNLIPPKFESLGNKNEEKSELASRLYLLCLKDSFESKNKIQNMKIKLREILGRLMFPWLEMQKPIVFRIDIIESSYKLELYKILISNQIKATDKEKALIQTEIIYVFESLWNLEKDNLTELSLFWDKNIRTISPDRNKVDLLQQYCNGKGKLSIIYLLTTKPPNKNYLLEQHTNNLN
uniref:Uncharacterized protein n=1 Tax=Meloidogyne floridensis TaxID=298350 RepID=A0A915P5V5_9BILA